ncbi:MAG: DUF4340 domain-containing protein [Polyangiaceae bacterium]|nr:DUF4340 domain-containing protein [Polyangiaceae bacterium]
MSLAATAKRHATTIVLSVLAVSGAVYVFVIDRGAVTTQEAEQRKRNIFIAWRPDDISEVTIERSGKTGKLTRRAPDARGQRFWDVSLGAATFSAEEQQVDQFLGTLEFATYERAVASGSVEPSALGMDHPRLRVSVTTSGRTTQLTLGAAASSPPGAVYAEVKTDAGTNLFVVTKELAEALDMDPEFLRARRLVPYSSPDIARFEVVSPSFAYHLERAQPDSDEMRLAGPTKEAKKRVSRRVFDEFLSTLGRTDAASFLADDVADKASSPAVTITFVPKDSARPRGVLAVGGDCPDKPEHVVAIQREPTRISACVPKAIADGLTKSPDALVDRALFVGSLDEVQEVAFTSGDKRLELARKGTAFHQRMPVDREVDASAGRALLEGLLGLRATDVLIDPDRAAMGLDKPYGTIRLTSLLPAHGEDGGDVERVEEIVVGAPRGDVVAVSRGKDGDVLVLPAAALRDLFPSDVALRSLTVIDHPETVVRALRIEQGDRVQRIERTAEGGWKLTEPSGRGLAADIGLGSDVATTLFPLKVERFVAEKDDGSFGLDKPRIVIDADIGSGDAGARNIRVLIGAPTTSGSFARIAGDDAVFVAPRAVEAVANQWLLDRAVFSLDLGDIVKVTVASTDKGKKPLVLERVGDALRIVGDPSATARAAELRDALGELAPDVAVSVGAPRKEQGLDPPALTVTIERARRDDGSSSPVVDPQRTVRFLFGSTDVHRGREIVYARRDGVDATYVIPQSKARVFYDTFR